MKKCSACDTAKKDKDFAKRNPNGDLQSWCRSCHANYVRLRNKAFPAEAREAAARQYKKRRRKIREYYQSSRGKKVLAKAQRVSRTRFPERYKAVTALNNAVRDGRLTRQPCEICGTEKSHGHHHDYSKPFDVKWLCRTHHVAEHLKQKRSQEL